MNVGYGTLAQRLDGNRGSMDVGNANAKDEAARKAAQERKHLDHVAKCIAAVPDHWPIVAVPSTPAPMTIALLL